MRSDAHAGGRTRITARLPPLPFLRDLLRLHAAADLGVEEHEMLKQLCVGEACDPWVFWKSGVRSIGLPVLGLARVSDRGCEVDHGPLTAWGEQSMLQLLMYRSPADAYEVQVEKMHACADPTALQMRRSLHRREDSRSAAAAHPLFVGIWGGSAGGCGIADAAG